MDGSQIVDLQRYPITSLHHAAGQALVDACRHDLAQASLCTLPGFVRSEALPALVAEAQALEPSAYRHDNLRTPYSWRCNDGFSPGHPRSQLFRNRSGLVHADQFPGDGPIERLYEWDPLTDFVREALGYETLHRSACPHLSLVMGVEGEEGQLGWHFDTNDAVISLLLQPADEGGYFEYAPYIRSEEDENYSQVARVFAGEPGVSKRQAMAPGTFILFKGRRSCRRVTPVGSTARPRLIALLSYDERPGQVFSAALVHDAKNPSTQTFYGQPA